LLRKEVLSALEGLPTITTEDDWRVEKASDGLPSIVLRKRVVSSDSGEAS